MIYDLTIYGVAAAQRRITAEIVREEVADDGRVTLLFIGENRITVGIAAHHSYILEEHSEVEEIKETQMKRLERLTNAVREKGK